MPKQAITLPNGRRVSLRTYARAWRSLRKLGAGFMSAGFFDTPERADVILAEIRRGLHDRINTRGDMRPIQSRAHPAGWARAASSRVVIERCDWRRMPRSARRALAHRVRENS